MPKSIKHQAAFKRGQHAESLARWYLRLQGFHIVVKNYKIKGGEVDIIARRGNLVLVVEVKARDTLQQAMEAVTLTSERRIETAATHWLSCQRDYNKLNLRFDMIALLPKKWPVHTKAFFTIDENKF